MNFDKVKYGSIALNVVLLLALGVVLHVYVNKPCPEYEVVIIEKKPVKDTKPKEVLNHVPVPDVAITIADLKQKEFKQVADQLLPKLSLHNVSVCPDSPSLPGGAVTPLVYNAMPGPCDTINIYSDTITQANSHTIIINDTTQGKHIGRSVYFVNLKPETLITKRLKEKWKVYVGAEATYGNSIIRKWGVGPSAALAIPKVGMIDYYYDALNNSHSAGFKALIRVKKY